ncbi:hypothetical protein BKA62DRAFT_677019 [Auriculariales sp. MPI-PUGE-AT-0066]|nr:hypothetical protein BKA62DRAFT_677019 [Auriculariales sp. MPI-PUGE-AT-0066]
MDTDVRRAVSATPGWPVLNAMVVGVDTLADRGNAQTWACPVNIPARTSEKYSEMTKRQYGIREDADVTPTLSQQLDDRASVVVLASNADVQAVQAMRTPRRRAAKKTIGGPRDGRTSVAGAFIAQCTTPATFAMVKHEDAQHAVHDAREDEDGARGIGIGVATWAHRNGRTQTSSMLHKTFVRTGRAG